MAFERKVSRAIDGLKYHQIVWWLEQECTCRPALPDGREFETCMPCRVRQDIKQLNDMAEST